MTGGISELIKNAKTKLVRVVSLHPNLVTTDSGPGGHARTRTGVHGFAGRCVTTPPRGHMSDDIWWLRYNWLAAECNRFSSRVSCQFLLRFWPKCQLEFSLGRIEVNEVIVKLRIMPYVGMYNHFADNEYGPFSFV